MNHVALVIPTLDRIGGAERQVILLAKGLAKRGWRITVVALSGTGGAAAGDLAAAGIAFRSLEMRKGLADPRGWIRFHRWLKSEAPDVLHAHLPHAAWLARWTRLGAPVRVQIDTVHTSATGTFGRRLGYRLSRWLPDRVTAVGQGVAEAYLSRSMISPGRLVVIPNGVDVDLWRPEAETREAVRRELPMGEQEFLWFAAGRFDPVKDYGTMLWALAQAPGRAHLAIAGTGPLEGEMRQLAGSLGLSHRVHFLGFQHDVLRWMQAADAFVQSSRLEGLPMGLLEAGACALPAVATDVPGSREVVIHAQTGWLAQAANPIALAEAMHKMTQASAEERQAVGESARTHVVVNFSQETVLDQWESEYRGLLERSPKPKRSA